MNYCQKCKIEFEGDFCPNCGQKIEHEKTCPSCGAVIKGNANFCSKCGYRFDDGFAGSDKAVKLWGAIPLISALLFVFFSVLVYIFYATPVAVMPEIDFILGKTTEISYGNLYSLFKVEELSELQSATSFFIAIAVICAIVAVITVCVTLYKPDEYEKIDAKQQELSASKRFHYSSMVFYLAFIIATAVALGKINKIDGGLGIVVAGSCFKLILIFSIVFLVITVSALIFRVYMINKYPTIADVSLKLKKTRKKLSRVAKKRLAITAITLLSLAAVITVSVIVISALTNVYTARAVSKINFGDDKQAVERILGEPTSSVSEYNWLYLSGETGNAYKKIEQLTQSENEKDWEKAVQLEGQLVKNTFDMILVAFGTNGKVTEIILQKNCGYTDIASAYEASQQKQCDKVDLNIDRTTVTVTIEKLSDGTEKEHYSMSEKDVYYKAYFTDGSYYMSKLTNFETNLSYNEENCMLTWKDRYTEYSKNLVLEQYYIITEGGSFWLDKNGKLLMAGTTEYLFLPARTREIPAGFFKGNKEIGCVIMPEGVTSIGEKAFRDCDNLSSIMIPDSVTSIGYQAFCYCGKLKYIKFGGTKEQWQAIQKNDEWNRDTPATVVHCTDGDVKI